MALAVPRLADVAVQMHLVQSPARATVHPGSRILSWALAGNHADRVDWAAATPRDGWWHLAAIDVQAIQAQPVLVAIGDSITDGYGVRAGSYLRWTDALSRRLVAQGQAASVVNTGRPCALNFSATLGCGAATTVGLPVRRANTAASPANASTS